MPSPLAQPWWRKYSAYWELSDGGISAQHIRPGMFKEFPFTRTHRNYFPTQFELLVCCLLSNVPQEKACGIVIPSEGEGESRVRLVLCAWSHYFFKFRRRYRWVLCAGRWLTGSGGLLVREQPPESQVAQMEGAAVPPGLPSSSFEASLLNCDPSRHSAKTHNDPHPGCHHMHANERQYEKRTSAAHLNPHLIFEEKATQKNWVRDMNLWYRWGRLITTVC